MAGTNNSSDDDLISTINITPLVDVVLVLLIIFLITAPVIYQSAIKVKLPSAKSGEQSEKSPLNFTITKDGELMLGKDSLDWKALAAKLTSIDNKAGTQTAIISADQQTAHGMVIKLMDALRQAGITRFAMNVEVAK